MGRRRRGAGRERRPGRALGRTPGRGDPSRIEERITHVRRPRSPMTQTGGSRGRSASATDHCTGRKKTMSVNAIPSSSCQGGSLSCNVTTIVAVIAAMTFSASGAAPTPLYQEYQSHFGLTPFMVTVIFAAYELCLLLALLTVGSLSDYIGRRPAIL